MTLSDFATFSTAISGVAVTISLIYLAVQTRQNSRHTRALIQQGANARTTSIMLANMEEDASAVWLKGNGVEPTPDALETVRFNLMCGTAVNAMEDLYFQYQAGLMDEELFRRNCEMFRGLLAQPGMRTYWDSWRGDLVTGSPKFCAFVDSLCSADTTTFKYRV